MEQRKKQLKYDKWFIMILGIMLWTLTSQLTNLAWLLPGNWLNLTLWSRVIASGLAIYGVVWVFRMYVSNLRRQTRRLRLLEEKLKDQPEIRALVVDVLKGDKQ